MDLNKENFYNQNRSYYDRNAYRYEAASWYYFNKYKNNAIYSELERSLQTIKKKSVIRVLEIGAGTGYLLGKLLTISSVKVDYTGIEHSIEMSNMLSQRYAARCNSFRVINTSVMVENLRALKMEKYDLIIGSSILHHLLDYKEVIITLSNMLVRYGVMYFVREPIHEDECRPNNFFSDVLDLFYSYANSVLMLPLIRHLIWPRKVKAEDATYIAYHMFKKGVSTNVFKELVQNEYKIIFMRKYNRRVSSLLSYFENSWLRKFRKDIYGNTLWSIGLQRLTTKG
ncbi:class I SAM-dependent methyltransferase [uncultured Desulfosarcina sp.]|uniref:class I SAM-dependent methyltransferase n=1 Tax=uncultured Desulfosarcina sp. TaxID=218289 RepID=UPI0029C87AB1|nr:class I SAM-dependent methyltransferase [uncultured Desulfosarcina sp.]